MQNVIIKNNKSISFFFFNVFDVRKKEGTWGWGAWF